VPRSTSTGGTSRPRSSRRHRSVTRVRLRGLGIGPTVSGALFQVITYYDSAGNPVKSILTNYKSRFTVTATANGKTLLANDPVVNFTSFLSDTVVRLGLVYNYTVPGAGVVLLETGRVVFDLATGDVLFEAGPHQVLEGDTEAFCSYFA
jgi:hypothetical protein